MRFLIRHLLKHTILSYYPTRFSLLAEIINQSLVLIVIWFAAKAFSGNFSEFHGSSDFFTYVVFGDLVVSLPLILFSYWSGTVSQMVEEGTMDHLMLLPYKPQLPVIAVGLGSFLLELFASLFTIVLVSLFFKWDINVSGILPVLLLQIICIPCFMGIGLISAAITFHFGRGGGTLDIIGQLATIGAGVYFPTSVLPAGVVKTLAMVSPFSLLLENSRSLITQGFQWEFFYTPALAFIVSGTVLLPLGWYFLGRGFKNYKVRGALLFAQ